MLKQKLFALAAAALIASLAAVAKADFVDNIKNKINGPVTKQSCRKNCDNPTVSWTEQAKRGHTNAATLKGACYASCEKYPDDDAVKAQQAAQLKAQTDDCKKNLASYKKQAADLNNQYQFLTGNNAKDQKAAVKSKLDPLNIKIAGCKTIGIE